MLKFEAYFTYRMLKLLERLLRFLASALAVTETGENAFAANNTTKILASLPGKTGIRHGYSFPLLCAPMLRYYHSCFILALTSLV